MRKIILAAAVAGAALSLAACSEGTEDNAEATMDSMAADTEANMDATGAAVDDAAADVGAAADNAGEATDQMGDEIEADVQDETVGEAAAD